MSWFHRLTGFHETSPQQVRESIELSDQTFTSRVNGQSFRYGRLEIPSLGELRARVGSSPHAITRIKFKEIISDSRSLHADKTNANSLFQVASQFNLLEMVSPQVTPERGIAIYEHDLTQGPACAIACGAGTIYRNYFVPVNGQLGQTKLHQIDCLAEIGDALGNTQSRLWRMCNGYVLPTSSGLHEVSERLNLFTESQRDLLRQLLRIGLQWNTQVTDQGCQHHVSQAFCSALPVAYSSLPPLTWEPFARLVLEATYEATFCAAILNARTTGQNKLYLTLVGGGAFGNATHWITDAIRRCADLFAWANLEVAIVSFRSSSPQVQKLLRQVPIAS